MVVMNSLLPRSVQTSDPLALTASGAARNAMLLAGTHFRVAATTAVATNDDQ